MKQFVVIALAAAMLVAQQAKGPLLFYKSTEEVSAGQRSTVWKCTDPKFKKIVADHELKTNYCRDAHGRLVRSGVTLQKFVIQGSLVADGRAVEVEASDRLDASFQIGFTVWTKQEWDDTRIRFKGMPDYWRDVVPLDQAELLAQEAFIERRAKDLGCSVKKTISKSLEAGSYRITYVDKDGKDCEAKKKP